MNFDLSALSGYSSPNMNLWSGRSDSLPRERFYQVVRPFSLGGTAYSVVGQYRPWCLIGFCSDAGVIRNLGRPGARHGPDNLRKKLAMTANPLNHATDIFDAGNVTCDGDNLELAQKNLGRIVQQVIKQGCRPLVLGGGHETAFGHYLGLEESLKEPFGIINLDAHFDLRTHECSTSGTPFMQVYKNRARVEKNFEYLCLGIQESSNSTSLFETAQSIGANFHTADDFHNPINTKEIMDTIENFCAPLESLYLSCCLDVFQSAIAPGVSSPQANGLSYQQIVPVLQRIAKIKKIIAFDVVELAPPFDINDQTASLGSHIIWRTIALDSK